MKLLLGLLLLTGLTSCDGFNTKKESFAYAKDGSNGVDGKNGTSCSTTQTVNGAIITCSDGSSSIIKNGLSGLNGANGANGVKGDKGDKGDSGQSIVGPKGDKGDSGTCSTGAAGANGKNAVVKQYSATSTQCSNGGIIIDSFTDVNGNSTYESGIDMNYQRTVLCAVVVTVVESDDEHHEKYHHNHYHNKTKDKDCEQGRF